MDKATLIAAVTIICSIMFGLIGVIYYSLKELIKQNLKLIEVVQTDIKEMRERYATKKEVKEVKVDLNNKLDRIMDGMVDQNKLLNQILLKAGENHET